MGTWRARLVCVYALVRFEGLGSLAFDWELTWSWSMQFGRCKRKLIYGSSSAYTLSPKPYLLGNGVAFEDRVSDVDFFRGSFGAKPNQSAVRSLCRLLWHLTCIHIHTCVYMHRHTHANLHIHIHMKLILQQLNLRTHLMLCSMIES